MVYSNSSKNDYPLYQVYFEDTNVVMEYKPAQKSEYDDVTVGERALVIVGIGNSYRKVYYGDDCKYEGSHLIETE